MFTDNIDTVQLFNSLSALLAFNWMLIQVADLSLRQELDFRVFHVPGVHNAVADALSRLQNAQLAASHPELTYRPFNPLDLRWGQLGYEPQALCSGQAAFPGRLVHGAPPC